MTRPLCPACLGSRVMGDKHPRPCSCCEDGHMRGIDDPTPEERRIAELEAKIRAARAEIPIALGQLRHLYSQMVDGFVNRPAEAARGLLGPQIATLERAQRILCAESDRLGGGA